MQYCREKSAVHGAYMHICIIYVHEENYLMDAD